MAAISGKVVILLLALCFVCSSNGSACSPSQYVQHYTQSSSGGPITIQWNEIANGNSGWVLQDDIFAFDAFKIFIFFYLEDICGEWMEATLELILTLSTCAPMVLWVWTQPEEPPLVEHKVNIYFFIRKINSE